MESDPRGLLLIVNNKKFARPDTFHDREGTDTDRDKLKELFENLGWIVEVKNDMTGLVRGYFAPS